MLRLVLMRHAKALATGEGGDHGRALADRGLRDAPAVAHRLGALFWAPDLVLSSDARRARETWEAMAAVFAPTPPLRLAPSLYLASADEVLDEVAQVDDDVRTLLVIGHNPGLEEAVLALAATDVAMPTATAVLLETGARRWAEAMRRRRGWRTVEVVRASERAS